MKIEPASLLVDVCRECYFKLNSRIQCDATRRQYGFAVADFSEAIGHAAAVSDLTDDNVAAMMVFLRARKLAAKTINERRGRINALWSWLAKRGIVDKWPTIRRMTEPKRIPVAWSRDELRQLLAACRRLTGKVGDVPANLWWESLHQVAWSTGERITALMSCRWEDLSGEWLSIPAEARKGKTADAQYRLSASAVESLDKIRQPSRELIWPWPLHPLYLWVRYKQIRSRAGLPTDRRSAFHRIRRSVASHFEAAGGNATALLGHSSRATTINAYLDPRIVKQEQAADRLFQLD